MICLNVKMICPKIGLHFRWKLSEADEKFGQFSFGIRCAFTRFCFSALSLFGFWKRNCFWDFSFWDSDHFGSSKKLLRKGCRRGLDCTVILSATVTRNDSWKRVANIKLVVNDSIRIQRLEQIKGEYIWTYAPEDARTGLRRDWVLRRIEKFSIVRVV